MNGRVVKTLQPGDKGTRRWVDKYGSALVCVRYRATEDQGHEITCEIREGKTEQGRNR